MTKMGGKSRRNSSERGIEKARSRREEVVWSKAQRKEGLDPSVRVLTGSLRRRYSEEKETMGREDRRKDKGNGRG